jgi:AcrR family transcriptional regulator
MDEVARVLHKSKATIYKYFKSREEIIAFGLTYKLEEIQDFQEILQDHNIPFLERYFRSIEHLSVNISDISNLFLSDLKHLYPELWEQVSAFINHTTEIIKDYYREGIDKGVFSKINPALMVMSDRFFFAALSDPDFLISHNLSIEGAFKQYFRMKFFGIVKDAKLLRQYEGLIR